VGRGTRLSTNEEEELNKAGDFIPKGDVTATSKRKEENEGPRGNADAGGETGRGGGGGIQMRGP